MKSTIKVDFLKLEEKPVDEVDAKTFALIENYWKCRIYDALNEVCNATVIEETDTSAVYELED